MSFFFLFRPHGDRTWLTPSRVRARKKRGRVREIVDTPSGPRVVYRVDRKFDDEEVIGAWLLARSLWDFGFK